MRRLVILATIALATSSCARNPAQGSVDSKTHKMCLQAKDYMGCVKAQTTQSSDIPSNRVFQGKTQLTGNSCPSGTAYSGAGYCTRVVCRDRWTTEPDLRNKQNWKCDFPFFKVQWGAATLKATYDRKCPNREPIIGTQSSCTTQADLDEMQAAKKSKKPLACRNGTWDENHPRCKDAGISSPMDMD